MREGQRESRIVSTTRAAAFAALAPSTMIQLHTADSAAWTTMARLTAAVPCFGLELGSDISAIPGVIASRRDSSTQEDECQYMNLCKSGRVLDASQRGGAR